MKRWKKILSLLTVFVMLFVMIPTWSFTASGLNYSQSEFLISNLNDWNDVASSSENFFGKTVCLANDIDASGAELTTLFENFAGTFDGRGHTIKNFTATGAVLAKKTLSGAVIKNLTVSGTVTSADEAILAIGMLVDQHDDTATGTLTVSDVTVKGSVTCASQQVGGVFGVLTLRDGQSATLRNITVDAQVVNNRKDLTHACISAGGVIGCFEPIGRPELLIKNVQMTGEIVGKMSVVGGIVGSVFSSDYMEDLYAGGTITISNCKISGRIRSESELYVQGTGGIVGAFGGFRFHYGDRTSYDGELNIESCVIGGEIENISDLTQVVSVGGVLGSMSYQHATVNVEHCLITATFPSNSLTKTDGSGAALILGAGASQRLSNLNVNNTVTTHKTFSLVGSMVGHEESDFPQLIFNGRNCQSVSTPYHFFYWCYSAAISDSSVVTVSQAAAESMVKYDTDGFIKRVGGQIALLGVQDNVKDGASLTSKTRYAIRLIAITSEETVKSCKINVIAHRTDIGNQVRFMEEDVKLYDRITAYDDNGVKTRSYEAKDFGGEKLIGLLMKNIPGGRGYKFEITPEFTTEDGLTVTGETVSLSYDKNGQYVKERESLDVEELPDAPTVRVMSSNILVADARGYHKDDIHNATGEVYDPAKDDGRNSTVIYKDGLNYYWYFRDDNAGEYFGRENGVAGTGLMDEQRVEQMAKMYAVYQPDFIGLQEVYGGTVINTTPTINMQQTLLSYLGEPYAYVDFTDKVALNAHWNPILYRTDKWRVIDKDIADEQWVEYANEMHRWQWAFFESLENPDWKFIVLNLHGPNNNSGADLKEFQPTFFASVNAQLKLLEQKYPDVPIAMTGDYNQRITWDMIPRMLSGTSLINVETQTENFELSASTIDHIFVTKDLVTVEQLRVTDNKILWKSTDHMAIYTDLKLKK